MPDLLIVWISLSMATAIFSWWSLLKPILAKLGKEHLLSRHYILSWVLWTIGALIAAPLVLPSIIFETYRTAYIDGFVEGAGAE